MPDQDLNFSERLKIAAQKLADKINNSSVGKAVEEQVQPNPNASTPSIKLYQKAADIAASGLSEAPKVEPGVDEEYAHKAILAVRGATAPAVKAFYFTPGAVIARKATDYVGITKPTEAPKDARTLQMEEQKRMIDALNHQKALAEMEALKAKLREGN